MTGKKSFFATLFGGHSSGCCNIEVVETPKEKKECCCDMQIVEDDDAKGESKDKLDE